MSEQIVRRTERIMDAQSAVPWLMVIGVYALLTAVGPKLLSDPDTYSHIALGRWILEHGTVPTTDPFSATLRGTHWVAFEWLSQVVFAIAHAAAGWTGVIAVTAVAMATALGLLGRFLQREWQPTAVLVAVLCAILLTAPHILARPHILALPVTIAWIALLIRAVDTRSSPPWLLLFALYRGVTLPWLRIVMLFGVLHLSLSQVRHADLLGLLAPILLARPLAEQFKEIAADQASSGMRRPAWVAAAALVVLIGITGLASIRSVMPADRITPARAIRAVDIVGAGPILNDYDFGGYLDFVGIPPFIDGRSELYGQAFILRQDRALSLQNLPDFLRLLDDYSIRTTLLAPSTPAVALLDRLPDWRRAYADEIAVVHTRR
jgi:U5 snRNP spliceosome subunit